MSDGLLLAACVLAVYRGARLVALDSISEHPREWLMRRAGRISTKLSDLFACPYCLSVHLAGWLTLALVMLDESVPLPLVWWWAVAGGAAVLVAFDLKMNEH